ncbi:phytoene desaturase family protein [Paenibacillus turpanensis]|uniref:phytoene desaturase family protein n=1 Tax=Paenibacillus turpanensis TaxID=2689078 RepID=UPI001409DD89|nr:FAD-dependent oxidoreductase [Paenibacillus turpanensis]
MTNNTNGTIWDVTIIGAGIAGLTASIFLAKAGHKVLLLEKGDRPGGRSVSTELSGARVNLGAHALNKSALSILQEVGVTPTGAAPKPPSTFVFQDSGGGMRAVPLAQLLLGSLLKWHEKIQLLRFYRTLYKTDTHALQGVSLQALLEAEISSPRVRSIVLALVRLATYCDDADLLSAGAAVEQLKQSQVLYVDGGWGSLVHRLTEQAKQAGVSIRISSTVREIKGSFPQMTVTLKDGVELKARNVISTAGPKETLAFLQLALTPEESRIYEQIIPVRAACLDLVVSGMPRPKTKFVLGVEDSWYYSNHSAAARLSDDPTQEVVHVMKYLSSSKETDPKRDELELTGFLDCIQPGWRKHVIQQRFLPRMLVSHGMVTAANGGSQGRPGTVVKGRNGLYVAGDWVGSAGVLVSASLASAKEAARHIIEGRAKEKDGNDDGA